MRILAEMSRNNGRASCVAGPGQWPAMMAARRRTARIDCQAVSHQPSIVANQHHMARLTVAKGECLDVGGPTHAPGYYLDARPPPRDPHAQDQFLTASIKLLIKSKSLWATQVDLILQRTRSFLSQPLSPCTTDCSGYTNTINWRLVSSKRSFII